ncbi:MAG: AAA family ATPase [Thermoprotei archaeon]
MYASKELLDYARENATKAIQYENNKQYSEAIRYYRRAIDALSKLIELYPDSIMNRNYARYIMMYRNKVEELEKLLEDQPEEIGNYYYSSEKERSNIDAEYILGSRPNIRWEDIIGLEDAKRAIIHSIVYPIKRRDLFPLGWPRGILLFGPPGCGKTMLMAAVANEINAIVMLIDSSNVMSKWLGESEKNIARVFKEARRLESQNKPVIILIDEVDALASIHFQEVGGETRMRTQLLKEMDGLMEKDRDRLIFVIGTTNKPWMLDEAFIRRFQKRILVPPPDFKSRIELFKFYTSKLKLDPSIDLEELAKMTEGYSASDILDVCRDAHIKVIEEFFEHNNRNEPRSITMEDFKIVIKNRKPSITKDMIERYQKWFEQHKAL